MAQTEIDERDMCARKLGVKYRSSASLNSKLFMTGFLLEVCFDLVHVAKDSNLFICPFIIDKIFHSDVRVLYWKNPSADIQNDSQTLIMKS